MKNCYVYFQSSVILELRGFQISVNNSHFMEEFNILTVIYFIFCYETVQTV
jgi:hypothetical protein